MGRAAWLAVNIAATIFVSAFLLFQIQPLVSKCILPWFGGSPAVWTTCMMFFQALLFGGYAYAHLSQRYLRPRWQAMVHLGLIVLALCMLRVAPAESWKPADSNHPVLCILAALSISVGVPYFVLSSTGPLLQAWFARMFPGRVPYRLYALSNFGSLLALVSYPFLVERVWDVPRQASVWSWGFVAYAALCGYAAISLWMLFGRKGKATTSSMNENEGVGLELAPPEELPIDAGRIVAGIEQATHISWLHKVLWVALPAMASVTLLATTNHISSDVAPAPLLWVAPLALYLMTFIIAFDATRWYRPATFATLTLVSIYCAAVLYAKGLKDIDLAACGGIGKACVACRQGWAMLGVGQEQIVSPTVSVGFVQYVVLNFVAMFGICMLCHGELVRLRPHPRHLTAYFLMIAAGGALGGAAVTLLAPLIFQTYFEFNLAFVIGYVLAIVVLARAVYRVVDGTSSRARKNYLCWIGAATGGLLLVASGIGLCDLPQYFADSDSQRLWGARNFFGTLSVSGQESDNVGGVAYTLRHGGVVHGVQFTDSERRQKPTTYYSEDSGIGRAIGYFRQHGSKGGMRVGAVGLGTGTLAAYIDQGNSIRFYEINPAVIELAESGRWFTYLEDCKTRGGKCEIELGDARLVLEKELKDGQPQHFQVLALDAFSGDAIPTHLLTEEAFRTYLKHLATDEADGESGALAIHISNRYLNLEPLVRGAAEKFDLQEVQIESAADPHNAVTRSDWIVLTRNKKLLEALEPFATKPAENRAPAALWTDGRSNLFDLLK